MQEDKKPETINIIADIAGRFDELQELLKKMPEADFTVFLGDLCDRGPKSKQVIEFVMSRSHTESLRGNHEQLMVNACRGAGSDIWLYNGGDDTCLSYGGIHNIPKEHVDWLASRPLYLDLPDLFLSHAPVESLENLPPRFSQAHEHVGTFEGNFIWNRYVSGKWLGKLTIHGHNSSYKEYRDSNGRLYTICLDHSRRGELRGIHWKNEADWQIYCQEYLSK